MSWQPCRWPWTPDPRDGAAERIAGKLENKLVGVIPAYTAQAYEAAAAELPELDPDADGDAEPDQDAERRP